MLVSVKHKGFSNLYVSDVTGLKYSLSLENILMARSSVWGQNTTMVDIHQVSLYHNEKHCIPIALVLRYRKPPSILVIFENAIYREVRFSPEGRENKTFLIIMSCKRINISE